MTGMLRSGEAAERYRSAVGIILAWTMVLGMAAGPAAAGAGPAATGPAPAVTDSSPDVTGSNPAGRGPPGFPELAASWLPAVVGITARQTVPAGPSGVARPRLPPGSPLEQFFDEIPGEQDGEGGGQAPHARVGLGSGFIIDPAGYVVTSANVVADADRIAAQLQDGTRLPAAVIGTDRQTDVALLKIDAPAPLPALSWGDSEAVRVGDWVLAIGNPFGLSGTVTAGIISARARDIHAGPYDDFLQTDAAINRGDSGGPLIDVKGEVIGVTTAIFSPTGGSVGIGFAVPSAIARWVTAELRETGTVRRGWLGIGVQRVTEDIAGALRLPKPAGALISSVVPDSPADKAELQPGDVILAVDGREVLNVRALPRIVAMTPVGSRIVLTVWRDGARSDHTVTIARLAGPRQPAAAAGRGDPPSGARLDGLGLSLSALSPELRERFAIAGDTKGVVVVEVDPRSVAAERGLSPGDVILDVGREPVLQPEEVVSAIERARQADEEVVLLRRQRREDAAFVALPVQSRAE